MKKVKYILLVFISLTMISCGGKDDGGGGNVDPPDPVNPPTASSLISPANNSSIIGIFQDSLLATYRITRQNQLFDKRTAMNILMNITNLDLNIFKKDNKISSFNILSQIYNENIQDSIMVCGSIDNSDLLILRNLNLILKYKKLIFVPH